MIKIPNKQKLRMGALTLWMIELPLNCVTVIWMSLKEKYIVWYYMRRIAPNLYTNWVVRHMFERSSMGMLILYGY